MINDDELKLCIVGLGYVGLPLAVEFGKSIPTIGYDINSARVNELLDGKDTTLETSDKELKGAICLQYTTDLTDTADANVYIVTVPTPIDVFNNPDLRPLQSSSRQVGSVLRKGDVVIFESTVYPGATEEICVPILEQESGLGFNEDFFVGYSPERINPGDKEHRITNILKITSGSTPAAAEFVDRLYQKIIVAGTHRASSLKVAEAAKIIENVQRDVNIALINELSLIFGKLDIDTIEILEAAGTKWNFLPFRPGLVGGHCIGIDPFYLTHKAREIGFHPQIISAARRINDDMGSYVSDQVVKLMIGKRIPVVEANILILGLAFKENCPDIRNTRVVDIIDSLNRYNANIEVFDPWVSIEEARSEFGIEMTISLEPGRYDAVIICVGHNEFRELGIRKLQSLCKENRVIFDVKSIFKKDDVDGRL
jgi:UDP-N-acetyl-D-galactosamine dehydrogenase